MYQRMGGAQHLNNTERSLCNLTIIIWIKHSLAILYNKTGFRVLCLQMNHLQYAFSRSNTNSNSAGTRTLIVVFALTRLTSNSVMFIDKISIYDAS